MTIQANGSFLSLSVSHGMFFMTAKVRLVSLLLGYLFFGVLAVIKYKLMRKFSK